MRLQKTLPYIVTGLFLVICAMLPALFLNTGQPEPTITAAPFDVNYRATMYKRADASELTPQPMSETQIESYSEALVSRRMIIDEMLKLASDSGSSETLRSVGTNYWSVTDETGRSIHYMEYYREWVSDWSNWFRIQLDLDTELPYHWYFSSRCVRNFDRYSKMDTEGAEKELAVAWGEMHKLGEAEISPVDGEHFELRYPDGEGGYISYYLWFRVYTDSAPSIVVDVEFTIMPQVLSGYGGENDANGAANSAGQQGGEQRPL